MTMRTELLRFNGAVERDPAIDAWMKEHAGDLGAIAQQWFEVMRKCGDEVRELLHDGCPVACLGDAPFGYVNVFTAAGGPPLTISMCSISTGGAPSLRFFRAGVDDACAMGFVT